MMISPTVHESLSGPSSTIQVILNSELRREIQVARSVRLKVSATLTYTGGDDFLLSVLKAWVSQLQSYQGSVVIMVN